MILALETSHSLCAVCLYDEQASRIVAEVANDIGRGHAERLMDDIEEALKQAGLAYRDLTSLVCGVGPGSFTGIRVGVAAARGFGLALNIPVHGVTSLQAIAMQARPFTGQARILAAIDAGRAEIYLQTFDASAAPADEPRAVSVAELGSEVPTEAVVICGSGAALFPDIKSTHASIQTQAVIATASAIAMASAIPAMRVASKPLYLRPPDAKPQSGFAVARR